MRDTETISTTDKAVALILSTFMNGRGEAFPSRVTLAKGAGLACNRKGETRSLDASLRRLEASGLIRISRSRGRSSHTYSALVATPPSAGGVAASHPPHFATATPPRDADQRPLAVGAESGVESDSESGDALTREETLNRLAALGNAIGTRLPAAA